MEALINTLVSSLEASFPGWKIRGRRDLAIGGVTFALYKPDETDPKNVLVFQEFVPDVDLVVLSLNQVANSVASKFTKAIRTWEALGARGVQP